MSSRSARAVKGSSELADSLANWMSEIEKDTGLAVRIVLRPSARRGILAIRVEAAHQVDGRLVSVEMQLKGEYPSSEATTLGGELFRLLVRLSKELGDTLPLLDPSSNGVT